MEIERLNTKKQDNHFLIYCFAWQYNEFAKKCIIVKVNKNLGAFMSEASFKRINLAEYNSTPHEIRLLFRKLFNPVDRRNLSEFNQSDIDRFIEQQIIITDSNGLLSYYQVPVLRKVLKYKQILGDLYPLISFKNNIEIMVIAWDELCDSINNLAKNKSRSNLIQQSIPAKDILRLEFKISNFLATINLVRDQCKNNFIKAEKNKITNTLMERYSKNQEKYVKLLQGTIDDERKLFRFVNALRNRMLHGGIMMYRVSTHIHQGKLITTILCDYEILDTSDNFNLVRDRLHHYYYDEFIFYLNHYLLFPNQPQFTETQLYGINQTLKVRLNDKNILLGKLTYEQISSLFKDKDFMLFDYKRSKASNIPSQGQFLFQISELLGQIYEAYIKYYDQLYTWIVFEHNAEIQALLMLNEELRNNKIVPLTMDPISFKLDIPKDNIFHN